MGGSWLYNDSEENQKRDGMKNILNISYFDCNNFGDRLGYHIINSMIPCESIVDYLSITKVKNIKIDDYKNYDLIILGNGGSIFNNVITYELMEILKRSKKVIGVFGLQYYDEIEISKFYQMMSFVDMWFARSSEDIDFAKPIDTVYMTGDVIINMFPTTKWTCNNEDSYYFIDYQNQNNYIGLDREIQRIQKYRYVYSQRLHPLICALLSAERVKYKEQINPNDIPSGKFKAILYDIFGKHYEENEIINIHKPSVVQYKKESRNNLEFIKSYISHLLKCP